MGTFHSYTKVMQMLSGCIKLCLGALVQAAVISEQIQMTQRISQDLHKYLHVGTHWITGWLWGEFVHLSAVCSSQLFISPEKKTCSEKCLF